MVSQSLSSQLLSGRHLQELRVERTTRSRLSGGRSQQLHTRSRMPTKLTQFEPISKRTAVRMAARTALAAAVEQKQLKQTPHGGKLVDLIVDGAAKEQAVEECDLVIEIGDRGACDVELLGNGAFSPLEGFMNEETYTSVVHNMRLSENGPLFGLPVVLDTSDEDIQVGSKVLLTYKGQVVATVQVESKWEPNKVVEAQKCYGTTSIEHPAVHMITTERGKYYMDDH